MMGNIVIQHDVAGMKGLCTIEPKVYIDNRGSFVESYNRRDFSEQGIEALFVQDNEVYNWKGVLRGLHFQKKKPQEKLIRVISGEIFDVVVDLRKESNTYQKWYGVLLSAKNKKQLYIPHGFAHGYLALTEAIVLFKVTRHYEAGSEIGIAWDSAELGIEWPSLNDCNYILNANDMNNLDYTVLRMQGVI